MKQAKILVTKEVIRVERTKGLTGSIYKGMFWHSTQFLLSSSGQADTKFMLIWQPTHPPLKFAWVAYIVLLPSSLAWPCPLVNIFQYLNYN